MSLSGLFSEHVVGPLRHAHGSPMSIARGAALGTWVAFTPTVGIQMFVVGVLGIPLRANIPVAVALVWLSNPVTMVPLYFAFYLVGTLVLAQPALDYSVLSERIDLAWETAQGQGLWAGLRGLFDFLGSEVVWPMAVGSFIMATALAVAAYHGALLWATRRAQRLEQDFENRQQAEAAGAGVQDGPPAMPEGGAAPALSADETETVTKT